MSTGSSLEIMFGGHRPPLQKTKLYHYRFFGLYPLCDIRQRPTSPRGETRGGTERPAHGRWHDAAGANRATSLEAQRKV
jgi:hypothetical protein